MEAFSALLAVCEGNCEFPSQRPVTQSFDVFFDLRPNKRLGKQTWGWWFETPSRLLWRHCNETCTGEPTKHARGGWGHFTLFEFIELFANDQLCHYKIHLVMEQMDWAQYFHTPTTRSVYTGRWKWKLLTELLVLSLGESSVFALDKPGLYSTRQSP